ncbi:MAG: DUF4912 domain-containing protein [Pyrinomonadaceae bacterium]
MALDSADMLEETPAPHSEPAPAATERPDSLALDETLPNMQIGDSIQLLLQSPHKLFLYWNLANDPATTLREAFGELAAHYRLMVRLVKIESGEEFLLEAARGRTQWFEVYPHHSYRADIGFHAENRPFVRLLSSPVVQTPPDSVSPTTADEPEFQLEVDEFARFLSGAGYERYASPLGVEAEIVSLDSEDAQISDELHAARARDAANEYPHR